MREGATGGIQEVTVDELLLVAQAWKPGRTSGPDGITYEALRLILENAEWGAWLCTFFNGVLRTGR